MVANILQSGAGELWISWVRIWRKQHPDPWGLFMECRWIWFRGRRWWWWRLGKGGGSRCGGYARFSTGRYFEAYSQLRATRLWRGVPPPLSYPWI